MKPLADGKPLIWPVPLCLGWGVACVAVPWIHLHAVAAIYQALGVVLTFFGLAAIGERMRQAREATTAIIAKGLSGVAAWTVRRREQLAVVWAKLIGKPRPVVTRAGSAHDSIQFSDSATATVHLHRVDRNTISDRDWLAHLDDRVYSLVDRLDAAEKRSSDDREEFDRRLRTQREALRAEIIRETRNGWQLVAWGLLYAFIGAVLSAFA